MTDMGGAVMQTQNTSHSLFLQPMSLNHVWIMASSPRTSQTAVSAPDGLDSLKHLWSRASDPTYTLVHLRLSQNEELTLIPNPVFNTLRMSCITVWFHVSFSKFTEMKWGQHFSKSHKNMRISNVVFMSTVSLLHAEHLHLQQITNYFNSFKGIKVCPHWSDFYRVPKRWKTILYAMQDSGHVQK